MAEERKDEETINPTDTDTGLGQGISAMGGGIPVGGGAMSGENDGTSGTTSSPLGSRDTDTGMVFGLGQGTSTGTLPTVGGPDMSGTGIAENSGVLSGQGYEPPYGRTTDAVTDPRSDEDKEERSEE